MGYRELDVVPSIAVYPAPGKKVIVIIHGVEYVFELEKGENFYFVISQEIGGEKHVVTG